MARFPEGEAEIAALALRIISGIESAGEEFGSPPISADTLRASLDAYNVAKDAIVSAELNLDTRIWAAFGSASPASRTESVVPSLKNPGIPQIRPCRSASPPRSSPAT